MTARDAADELNPGAEVDVVVVEATVSTVTPQPPVDGVPHGWRVARLVLGLADAVGDAVATAVDRRVPAAGSGWDVAVGAGLVAGSGVSAAGRLVARVVRPVTTAVLHPPLVPEALHPARGIAALAQLGGQERAAARRDLDSAITAVVPILVEQALARIPLTELVTENVDIDAIVAGVDLDAIAQRIDIGAVIERIDMVGLADKVIEGIDLPEIIRASTGTVASEVVRGVRMQTIDADQAVARFVDRLFLRRRGRATDAPGEPQSAVSADEPAGEAPT